MTELRLWNRSLTFVSYSCERGECARCTESLRKQRLPVESIAPICTHECHQPHDETVMHRHTDCWGEGLYEHNHARFSPDAFLRVEATADSPGHWPVGHSDEPHTHDGHPDPDPWVGFVEDL